MATEIFTNNSPIDANKLNTNFQGILPIGGIGHWLKTFVSVSSGTATTNTVDQLVDTGATFQTDGVEAGMIIHNTTDDTFGIVSSVDSETSISISADIKSGSSTTDVFPDGNENYVIYATPQLEDGWIECNGQTISDADSPFNGSNAPDLNSSISSGLKGRFLRGHTKSGDTESSQNLEHTHNPRSNNGFGNNSDPSGRFSAETPNGLQIYQTSTNTTMAATTSSGGDEARPHSYAVVMIMRIK